MKEHYRVANTKFPQSVNFTSPDHPAWTNTGRQLNRELKSASAQPPLPKGKTPGPVVRLDAIGKPYGANYDPNYRMRHKLTSINRLYKLQDFQWRQA